MHPIIILKLVLTIYQIKLHQLPHATSRDVTLCSIILNEIKNQITSLALLVMISTFTKSSHINVQL